MGHIGSQEQGVKQRNVNLLQTTQHLLSCFSTSKPASKNLAVLCCRWELNLGAKEARLMAEDPTGVHWRLSLEAVFPCGQGYF